MAIITLHEMEFYAFHGCFKEEQLIGNYFTVDIEINTNTDLAETEDDLSGTVNYQEVYNLVKDEMAIKSKLLEHVVRRITDKLIKSLPQIESCRITLSKLHPPLGGKVNKVSVTLAKSA
ncbi:MAG: dihydroneopterin aldolase [Bacteroidetes bacterium]|nr:dihydroneopterin aldolase [Bacteroidota bacterium]